MWHHSFDPHSVASIPLAELKPQPMRTHQRSESVRDFLDRSKLLVTLTPAIEKDANIRRAPSADK